jgi:predicted metal-binding membrane protein
MPRLRTARSPLLGESLDRTAVAVIATLIALAGLGWVVTSQRMAGMDANSGTDPGAVGFFLATWVVMMAAMMLPSVTPTVSLYLRTLRPQSNSRIMALRSAGLVIGYLGAWATFGILAFAAAAAGSKLAAQATDTAAWVGALLLAGAGGYQLSPLKDRCLKHCRSPFGFLVHFGSYRGRLRDLRVGLYHGAYCVGCCWGLMVVLITVGVMNLAWMVGIAAVVFIEKTWRHGKAFSAAFGLALIVFALFVPWHPGLIPGLHIAGDQATCDNTP